MWTRWLCLLVVAGFGLGLEPPVAELLDEYWTYRTTESPEFASFVGIHDSDHLLDNMTLEAYEAKLHVCQDFLARAEELLLNTSLPHADVLNLGIFKVELETYIEGYPFMGFLTPLSYSEGIHVDFERLLEWTKKDTYEDYQNVLSRLSLLPVQARQVTELLREGVRTGILQHEISMKGVADALGQHVVEDAASSPLWRFFETLPDALTESQKEEVRGMAEFYIVGEIGPAMAAVRDYVQDEYSTRPSIAVTSLPYGKDRYDQLLRFHTSTSMSPAEIHQLGLEEVVRIEGEMAKIVSELGYEGMSVPEFSAMIRNDSRFYLDSAEAMMELFNHVNFDLIPPRLPGVFEHLPEAELILVDQPKPSGPLAFYLAGSYDGSRPGVFYVNTYFYDTQPTYEVLTLCLHEGNPGHHLQGSHSIESPSTPFFRRAMEDRNYYQAPSRFPMNTAFIEGWGLYAEGLGFDMGLYADPYDRYGHYSFEIFRACRLVVDTGIHSLGWTRDDAVQFMYTHTALALSNIQNEVDRYITTPGQALAYKVGERTISRLRAKAETELGELFDIAEFHHVVLNSAGPLDYLEREVDEWIAGGGGGR